MPRVKKQYRPISNFHQLTISWLTLKKAEKLQNVFYFRKKFVEVGKAIGYKATGKMTAFMIGDPPNRWSHPILWKPEEAKWVLNHGPYSVRDWIKAELASFEEGQVEHFGSVGEKEPQLGNSGESHSQYYSKISALLEELLND